MRAGARAWAVALALLALPAAAEERLDAEAFRRLSEGWTLHFELGGASYGSEQYFEGHRSIWRVNETTCEEGVWFERDGAICFTYEGARGPFCWFVLNRGGEVFARSVNDPEGLSELHMIRRDKTPLDCPGPSVGA